MLSISIFSRMSLLILICLEITLLISISICSRKALSIAISIFLQSVDISIINMAYRTQVKNSKLRFCYSSLLSRKGCCAQNQHTLKYMGWMYVRPTLEFVKKKGRYFTDSCLKRIFLTTHFQMITVNFNMSKYAIVNRNATSFKGDDMQQHWNNL